MDLHTEFDLEEIDQIAIKILQNVNSRVILFYGKMGMGKTTLIKSIVKALGGKTGVTSPTFSLVNEYEIEDGLVYHFDFYRINDPLEAMDIGFEDYLESGHWILIEWPEKIDNLLPEEVVRISLEEGKRCSRALDLELVKSNY